MGYLMSYKVCQCIFSTNRPEYLTRTLDSHAKFDFTECEVERVFFDDFPQDRDDSAILKLVQSHGYFESYLHKDNMSIGATWEEFWNLIKDRDYDYVLHHEDDAELIHPVKVVDMIEVLRSTPKASQVVLKRQPWYAHESPSAVLTTDLIFPVFRGEYGLGRVYFNPITSLYSMDRVRFDYKSWYRRRYPNDAIFHTANINEALIGKALLEEYGLQSLHLKSSSGGNLIEHIGEYTVGKKLLPHEPGYALFSGIDPTIRYVSGSHAKYLK